MTKKDKERKKNNKLIKVDNKKLNKESNSKPPFMKQYGFFIIMTGLAITIFLQFKLLTQPSPELQKTIVSDQQVQSEQNSFTSVDRIEEDSVKFSEENVQVAPNEFFKINSISHAESKKIYENLINSNVLSAAGYLNESYNRQLYPNYAELKKAIKKGNIPLGLQAEHQKYDKAIRTILIESQNKDGSFTRYSFSMLYPFLGFSYKNILPNYGIAIILLTILIKIVFYPLTKKQFVNMKEMQKIQPIIKKVQEKYKGNPQQQQQELLKVWKEHKVNPLSGCLPILVQLPVFFAIFATTRSQAFTSIIIEEGINAGLLSFWCAKLCNPDSLYILPLLIAVSTYFTQKLTPQTAPMGGSKMMNPIQTYMKFMPILMFVISMNMPAGVLLYWAISQVLSAFQQHLIMRKAT